MSGLSCWTVDKKRVVSALSMPWSPLERDSKIRFRLARTEGENVSIVFEADAEEGLPPPAWRGVCRTGTMGGLRGGRAGGVAIAVGEGRLFRSHSHGQVCSLT